MYSFWFGHPDRRSVAEVKFFVLRKRVGSPFGVRTWVGRYRELALKTAEKNIDRNLGPEHRKLQRLNKPAAGVRRQRSVSERIPVVPIQVLDD